MPYRPPFKINFDSIEHVRNIRNIPATERIFKRNTETIDKAIQFCKENNCNYVILEDARTHATEIYIKIKYKEIIKWH